MPGAKVALDTNVAIALLNGHPKTARWALGFREIYLPSPVIGELCYGALNSGRPAENLRRIEDLTSRCIVLGVQLETAQVYARLRMDLKQKGKPIPENDLWIAAVCVEQDLPLATTDGHFREVSSLSIPAVPAGA
jgi:tRNA(fMet)-specific endonuclease VapC